MNTDVIVWYAETFKKEGPLINETIAARMCSVGTSCITKWKKKGQINVLTDPEGRELLKFNEIRDLAIKRESKLKKTTL